MTFVMLNKLRRPLSGKIDCDKNEMCRDESETSRCCDLSFAGDNSTNDDSGTFGTSNIVELQDDLRAKTAQCAILRETLATMSATMRRQEFQIEENMVLMEKYLNTIEIKTSECNEWKNKYEELASKIENNVNTLDHIPKTQVLNTTIPHGHFACDPLAERRPWKGKINSITKFCDDQSTASDSIDNQHAEFEIKRSTSGKRQPKRKAKRNTIKVTDCEIKSRDDLVHLELPEGSILDPLSHNSDAKVGCHERIDNYPANARTEISIEMLTNNVGSTSCKMGETIPREVTETNNENESTITNLDEMKFIREVLEESELDVVEVDGIPDDNEFSSKNSDNETENKNQWQGVGFSFDVEVPFSDPETEVKTKDTQSDSRQSITSGASYHLDYKVDEDIESVLESEIVNQSTIEEEKSSPQIEILSLTHFIQLHDKYELDDVADICCATDLTTKIKDEDSISVVSFDSQSMHLSNPTSDKFSCSTEENKGSNCVSEADRTKEAKRLRRRVIKTAKRESKRAQFPCEVVEC
jgi:hypothetical protein